MKTDKSIIFTGKTNDGKNIIIRYPKMSDLSALCKYINKLSRERTFITYQGEKISLKEEGDWLKKALIRILKKKEVFLCVFADKKIIGISGVRLGIKIKQHVGGLGISIDKDYRGKGLGKLLMNEVLKEAKKKLFGLKIVTLEVFELNKTAQSLYKKMGFKNYGHLPNGLIYRGKYTGEFLMYKKI